MDVAKICILAIIIIITQVDNQIYFEITNNSSVSQLSILLIIVGLFVMIVGGIGAVGAIFASTVFGRITLGLVSWMCNEPYGFYRLNLC